MECPFCSIINRQKKAHIVLDSENVVTLLDIDPINEGHVLIIPKQHESSIDQIPTPVLNEVFETAQKIVAALKRAYPSDGYSIMQNGGDCCDFGHLHVHVFPRYKNDGFGWNYPAGDFEYSAEVAQRIKDAMCEP